MKIIAISNQKGGVGKTTTTIELAASITKMKKKVLIIDLDQQCNATDYTGSDGDPEKTIYEVLHAKIPVQEAIIHLKSYDVIPASPQLSKSEKEFVEKEDVFLLSDIIELIKDEYDYILIDNGRSRSILLTMAYTAADYVVIPTECDDGSLKGIDDVISDVDKCKNGRIKLSHAKIIAMLLTKSERTTMHSMALEDMEEKAKTQDNPVIIDSIRKGIVASETKKVGKSAQEYANKSNFAEDYRRIAKKIVGYKG